LVPRRTRVTVAAVAGYGLVFAAVIRSTDVLGAGVPVVAFLRSVRYTLAIFTVVPLCAGVVVVALGGIGHEQAPLLRVTGVVGAGVAVIAQNR